MFQKYFEICACIIYVTCQEFNFEKRIYSVNILEDLEFLVLKGNWLVFLPSTLNVCICLYWIHLLPLDGTSDTISSYIGSVIRSNLETSCSIKIQLVENLDLICNIPYFWSKWPQRPQKKLWCLLCSYKLLQCKKKL